jgi:hypothetical protein
MKPIFFLKNQYGVMRLKKKINPKKKKNRREPVLAQETRDLSHLIRSIKLGKTMKPKP